MAPSHGVIAWLILLLSGSPALAEPNTFHVVWSRIARAVPTEFKAQGTAPSGPTEGERLFVKQTVGPRGGAAVVSTIRLTVVRASPPGAAALAQERAGARASGLELLDMGDFAAFKYPAPPQPKAPKRGGLFRRPAPQVHGEMSIFVIAGAWQFKITLSARKEHFGYDAAKRLALETAEAAHVRLGLTIEGGLESPRAKRKALQLATRIVLEPGQSVDPELSNPEDWQAYIDAVVAAGGRELPAGYENVAQKFRDVGESMRLPDGRKLNWPALLVQSLHETGYYKFGRRADASNFNVAGVGITEDETSTTRQDFGDLPTGVKAFFEHMSVYATGAKVKDPVAKRTRASQATVSKRITKFLENFPNRGPIALRDLGSQFAADAVTARKWSGLAPEASDAEHIAHLKAQIGAAHAMYGGGTLGYCGCPLYGGGLMDMWIKATAQVRRNASTRREKQPRP